MLSVVRDEMVAALSRDDLARDCVRHLQARYARRERSAFNARRALARDLGVAPGRVERFFAGRVKGVKVVDCARIVALYAHETEREAREAAHRAEIALTHRAELARQCGGAFGGEGLDGESLIEIETHLAAVRKILGR
jgi:hypothetical protein